MRSTLYLKFIIMYIIFGFQPLYRCHADGRTDERPVKGKMSLPAYRVQPGGGGLSAQIFYRPDNRLRTSICA